MLQLLIRLFGKDYVNRAIGTRTNVSKPIQLDQNSPFKLYSDDAYDNPKARQLIEDKIAEYGPFALSNKNASEVANFEMNARRLLEAKNKEFGVTDRLKEIKTAKPKPEADVIDIGTKKKVDEQGLGSLRDDFGLPEGVDPKSERGKLMQELQRTTAGSKKAESLAKQAVETMFGPLGRGAQKDVMQEGRRRAVVRQIMIKDKRIGLTDKELEDLQFSNDLQPGTDAKDPLELFDKYYTRNNNKFDALDNIIDGSRSPDEAAEGFMKEFDGFDIVAPAKPKPASLDDEVDELDEFLDDTPRDDKAKGGLADILGV